MLRKLAMMTGYAKAPKATYVLRHPKKGLAAMAAAKGLKSRTGRRVASGVVGAGALALAVPLGIYLMNR